MVRKIVNRLFKGPAVAEALVRQRSTDRERWIEMARDHANGRGVDIDELAGLANRLGFDSALIDHDAAILKEVTALDARLVREQEELTAASIAAAEAEKELVELRQRMVALENASQAPVWLASGLAAARARRQRIEEENPRLFADVVPPAMAKAAIAGTARDGSLIDSFFEEDSNDD